MREFEFYITNNDKSIMIYVDKRNKDSINLFIDKDNRKIKTFITAIKYILSGLTTKSTYEYYPQFGISAIKFKGKDKTNPRIYCIQHTIEKTKHILMVEFYAHKSTQEINKKIKSRFTAIKKHQYGHPFENC